MDYDFSGVDKPKNEKDYYGLRYAEFVVPLVKAIQEQQKMIEELRQEVNKLKERSNSLSVKSFSLSLSFSQRNNKFVLLFIFSDRPDYL